jgi:glycosyltransferase involved in cell wall biosynthesis
MRYSKKVTALILSPDAYSIFFPRTSFVFGGIEVETGYYARGLAKDHGVDVTVVTRDQGLKARHIDCVNVIPHPLLKGPGYWDMRCSLLGRLRHRISGERQWTANEFYSKQKPDVAYVQGMAPWTLDLARYCLHSKTPFLFRIAHDMDLGGDHPNDASMNGFAGFDLQAAREIINTATQILVQTPAQMEMLERRFNRKGVLLLNPVDERKSPEQLSKVFDVLWIGKSTTSKRPEIYLKLAEQLPHRSFCMVLNKVDLSYWDRLTAAMPVNIKLIEKISFPEVRTLFEKSRIFVSTSGSEGFANTFLQAASHGVPILSMNCDPNQMLSAHGAGVLTGPKIADLALHMEHLLSKSNIYSTFSAAARRYVSENHSAQGIVSQFYKQLKATTSSTKQQNTRSK